MNKPLIDQLVDRFLACPLPEGTKADPCACNPNHPHRTGTNLLTAIEAKQVLQHVAGDLVDAVERLEVECAASRKVLLRISEDASGTERIRTIAKDALGL